MGRQEPDNIAAQERAALVGDKWPVCIAIGRDQGINAKLASPLSGQGHVLRSQSFRVNGDETLGATDRHDIRTKTFQNFDEQVTGH